MSNQDTGPAEWQSAAGRIEEDLVLSVAYEPPDAVRDTIFGLDDAALRRIVALTLARVGVERPIELSLLVTGDEGLRDLNREYRGKDEATDVLSFPLLDAPIVEAPDDQLWQPAEETEEDGDAFGPLDDLDASAIADDVANGTDGDGEGDAFDLDSDVEDPFLTPEDDHLHVGDIALSRDAIERQAAQAAHSPARELAFLLSHGVLHLVGYDDTTDAGYRAMVAHQEAVLQAAGIDR